MRIFCGHLGLALMEVRAINWKSVLAIIWLVDDAEQRPEWSSRFGADHPGGGHAAQLRDARLDAGKAKLFVGIVGVQFAKNVFVTVWRFEGKSIGSVDFENGFDQLKTIYIYLVN